MWLLATIFLYASAQSLSDAFTTVQSGDGTYYGETTGGHCSLSPLSSFVTSTNMKRVALNHPQYSLSGGSGGCGMCIKVWGDGGGSGAVASKPPIGEANAWTVYVTDECPECLTGSIDFGWSGDGRWNIFWKAVDCPVIGNLQYIFQGSNPYYMKVQARNNRIPIQSLEFQLGGAWYTGSRTTDDFFLLPSGAPTPVNFPLTVRVTGINGNVVVDRISVLGSDNTVLDGMNGVQLSSISSSTPPTAAPTKAPTSAPTAAPTKAPTSAPTAAPTAAPTKAPTSAPTAAPTKAPTNAPTAAPTAAPTKAPTAAPTATPTSAPTKAPTSAPTAAPTKAPTSAPVASSGLPWRGTNLAGLDFGSPPGTLGSTYVSPTTAEVDYFVGKGFTVLRLPFLWERLQTSLNSAFDSSYFGLIDALVQYATVTKGVRIVLDPHNYARYNNGIIGQDVAVSAFNDLWTRLANQYKSNSKVIFGLMNEPNSMDTQLWANDAKSAVAAIRATGATNLILVPGNSWTGAHSWTSGSPSNGDVFSGFSDSNFAFEVHQYLDSDSSGTSDACVSATIGSERLAVFTNWARPLGFKGFLGEWAGGRNALCYSAIQNVVSYIDSNKDVYIGWTWWAAGPWWGDYIYALDQSNGVDRPQIQYLTAASTPVAPAPVAASPTAAPTSAPTAPVATQSPVVSSISTPNSKIPTTGSFQVTVGYQAFQSGSQITVDILDSNGWVWYGTGTLNVNAGSANGVVTVTVASTPVPVVSTIQLKAWIVNPADIGNWQAATGTMQMLIPVSVGTTSSPTSAPTAPTSAPKAPTSAPVVVPVVTPTSAPKAPTSAPTAAPTNAPKAPTSAPVAAGGCVATLYGTGNGDWWDAIKVSPGVSSAKITCTDTTVTSSCSYGWTDNDNYPIWFCQLSGVCKNPTPSCTKGSGARLSEEPTDGTTNNSDAPSADLATWQIVLIALAAVFALASVVLLVVGLIAFTTRRGPSERV